jgi:hypothetical protein
LCAGGVVPSLRLLHGLATLELLQHVLQAPLTGAELVVNLLELVEQMYLCHLACVRHLSFPP